VFVNFRIHEEISGPQEGILTLTKESNYRPLASYNFTEADIVKGTEVSNIGISEKNVILRSKKKHIQVLYCS
jgi:hypothetical protein